MELLDIVVDERAGWSVLELVGQLDVATAPELRQALQEAQYGGGARVVVDLTRVEFLDSFGLGVLVGGLKRARLQGGRFVLAGAGPRVQRIFEVTGLDSSFRQVAHVEELGSS